MEQRTTAAYDAAKRLLGSRAASQIVFRQMPCGRFGGFCIETDSGRIRISGDNCGSMLCGLGWYLRNVLRVNLSWETPALDIPDPLPAPPTPIVMASPYRYRYYLNYCTFSYTMAWWDWPRWEKELDLMALGGINLALNLVGQESVWLAMLEELGMSAQESRDYLVGPAHLAWFFMGNMTRFGGTPPEQWFKDRAALGRRINARMLELGITPVFPGFYGMLPEEIKTRSPDSDLLSQGQWCGFDRPAYILPDDPLFLRAGRAYYRAQHALFGSITAYFAAEPFHEGGDPAYFNLPEYGKAILSLMREFRQDAVWTLQAWDGNPLLQLFDALEPQDVLILNLLSGRVSGSGELLNNFEGRPWVWCPVHSYGGRNAMYGFLRTLAREPLDLLNTPGSSLCGIGLAPESLETNPIFYDLFWDVTYRSEALTIRGWLKGYIRRRYGYCSVEFQQAWLLLEDSVYNSFVPQPGGAESFLCARPDFHLLSVSTWGPKNVNYDVCFVRRAARLLFSQFDVCADNRSYLYDLVDVTRQALSNISRIQYARLMYLLSQQRHSAFREESKQFLLLLETQEQLLSSLPEFCLEKWLAPARRQDRIYKTNIFEQAAKTLITVWGPRSASAPLHDYSSREWGGLTGAFYYARWKYFFDTLNLWLTGGNVLGSAALSRDWAGGAGGSDEPRHFAINWYDWEMNWIERPVENPFPALDTKTAVQNAFTRFIDTYKDH